MIKADPDFKVLHITTIDAAQGLKFDYTIINVTIVGNTRFLNNLNRIVVATSRTKIYSNLIIDKIVVFKSKSRVVKRITAEYQHMGVRVRITSNSPYAKMRSSKFYKPGIVDFKGVKTLNIVIEMITVADAKAETDNNNNDDGNNNDDANSQGQAPDEEVIDTI